MISRLALGTVQLGMAYGINNKTGRVSQEESGRLLVRAGEAGIDTLDTAQAYGESESVLGLILADFQSSFRIVSKFSVLAHSSPLSALESSLAKLRQQSLYGFLYHKFSDYNEFPEWHNGLLALKETGRVAKVGFSLYRPSELELLLDKNVPFDIIQVPYSVFDRRFEPYFGRLKDMGIEIHVRSVFLQGLVFVGADSLISCLEPMRGKLELLNKISRDAGIPLAALCLCFVVGNKNVDRIVIGVDGSADLDSNISALKNMPAVSRLRNLLAPLAETDEQLILPMNWRK